MKTLNKGETNTIYHSVLMSISRYPNESPAKVYIHNDKFYLYYYASGHRNWELIDTNKWFCKETGMTL